MTTFPSGIEIHNRFCGENGELCQAHRLMQENPDWPDFPTPAPVVNIQTLEKKHLIYLAAVTLFSKGAHSGLNKEQTEALLTKSWNVAEVIYTAYEETGRL